MSKPLVWIPKSAAPPLRSYQREYLNAPWVPSNEQRHACGLWTTYYRRCDAFDNRVCTGQRSYAGAIPANGKELAAINRHASQQLQWLQRQAALIGISYVDNRIGQRMALRDIRGRRS